MIKKLYPIRFNPIPKERVWGGKDLVRILNKPFAEDADLGESWEISDLEDNDSVILNDYLQGNTLSEVLETYLGDLVGDEIYNYFRNSFPLLVKLLDIRGELSVQVHPNDEIALERYDSYGKSEAWYILDADEDAAVYMGFNREVSAAEFYNKCKEGTVAQILNRYTPRKGDLFYIEAGTVHAAKGGVLMAEVQQSSDITFRLYDWGRENGSATARQMHLEEGIDSINYEAYNEGAYYLRAADSGDSDRILVQSDYFTIREHSIAGKRVISPSMYNSFIIYMCIEGDIIINSIEGDFREQLKKGETILIPASLSDFELISQQEKAKLLEIYIDDITKREDYVEESHQPDMNDSDHDDEDHKHLHHYEYQCSDNCDHH